MELAHLGHGTRDDRCPLSGDQADMTHFMSTRPRLNLLWFDRSFLKDRSTKAEPIHAGKIHPAANKVAPASGGNWGL
jgi:hypothetical protein